MAITKMGMLVVVVGLLAMVQQSVQMSSSSMLKETRNDLSYWAIVFSGRAGEKAIQTYGDFKQTGTETIAGRVFRTGVLLGRRVVLVNTGKYSVNVSSGLQVALSAYPIRGVLYFGTAGRLSGGPIPKINHVIIPRCVAFSAIWDWLAVDSNPEGHLVFGDFNKGENQQNALGSVKFNNMKLCNPNEEWMKKAEEVEEQLPHVHLELVVASSDMKIYNKAYARFLFETFEFAAADHESAPVASVSKSNDKRYMLFNGVPDPNTAAPIAKQLATANAYHALRTFLRLLPEPRGYITTYV